MSLPITAGVSYSAQSHFSYKIAWKSRGNNDYCSPQITDQQTEAGGLACSSRTSQEDSIIPAPLLHLAPYFIVFGDASDWLLFVSLESNDT